MVDAEQRDLMKDSCTSLRDVMDIVDRLRREEELKMGRNPLANLPVLSYSTMRKVALKIAPVAVRSGTVQNESRRRALRDPRNATSCASVWSAVSSGITNGKFIHSWDEVGVMLNGFDEKQNLRCTKSGKKKLNSRNLAPSTTELKQQRRMLKIGLSKYNELHTYLHKTDLIIKYINIMQIQMHTAYWNVRY